METSSLRDSYNKWQQQKSKNSASSPPPAAASSESSTIGGRFNNLLGSLPIYNQDTVANNTEPGWYSSLSMWERYSLFFIMFLASCFCFTVCILLLPVLSMKPRKFALLWSMGSFLFITSFGVIRGPYTYIKHLFSRDRMVFTVAFFLSFVAVIYFSVVVQSSILSVVAILIESISLIYYVVSYFPFGRGALTWISSAGVSTARGALRI
ncbi:SFT2-domain-containing protein [Hanseniaspora valbyensis NRRL Y-1626]|uniref:Protein transport protein SFT2 n=1 Tax=Hanseniaspora valbyensis NRRL Y-1626 TaxID=766949 RepID=A0A1B7TJZ7_9ASCO|nr:SFT2-domain-containing protein [Hanseniaspora valbyensis NRRL Y-1626]